MVQTLDKHVEIPVGLVQLQGDMHAPSKAAGVVAFAHGSGSSRLSPRNRYVAERLQRRGFATLLMDLLTPEEDEGWANRFDIGLLTERLIGAIGWLERTPMLSGMPIGLFGASTGSAAALAAAAKLSGRVAAVVSRGGRPDLASDYLHGVLTPSLFIVGGADREVLMLNEKAIHAIPEATVKRLEVVPGATHLFEEAGALEQVAELAGDWFAQYAAKEFEGPV